VISGSNDKTIGLWDTNSGKLLRTLKGHLDQVWCVAIGYDITLASASKDKTARLWNLETGELLQVFSHANYVSDVAFSPQHVDLLASACFDNNIYFWQSGSKSPVRLIKAHEQPVLGIAFSHNGKFVASSSADNSIGLWDVRTGECILRLTGHSEPVRKILFSLDDSFLISCSEDKTIGIFEIV